MDQLKQERHGSWDDRLARSLPSSPVSLGKMTALPKRSHSSPALRTFSCSTDDSQGAGPARNDIFSRRWCSEQKRFLHDHRQRQWLQNKAKHGYIDFSDVERAELRRYFDALATSENKIGLDRLETMLISLGLASTSKEVRKIVAKIDADGNEELDFEEYLEIFRAPSDNEIFKVFKAMMEGRLGDPNLNFQTVISAYRRKLFLDATGARTMRHVRLPSDKVAPEHSAKVLQNFATLQRSRYSEAAEASDLGLPADPSLLPFDPTGGVPPGGLGMVWRGLAAENGLVSSRPASADKTKHTLGPPPSPRKVLSEIVKVKKAKKKTGCYGSTIVIRAPVVEEGAQEAIRRRRSSSSGRSSA